jgi:hypothetical protein
MVGKVRVRGQGKVMKGRRQTTTTYKHGGRVKKQVGGVMPGIGTAGGARPLVAGGVRPLAPGARTMVRKGGPAAPSARRKAGPSSRKKTRIATTSFHKSKAAALKDKGKPNTPGEFRRETKGKMTMGRIRTKKVLKGDYDLGKQMRKRRKHHDQT